MRQERSEIAPDTRAENSDVDWHLPFWEISARAALTKQEIHNLLSRNDLQHITSEAIRRSMKPGNRDFQFSTQEFGFVAYRHFDSRKIYLSPIVEGKEASIELDYIHFPRALDDKSPNKTSEPLLMLHTHPLSSLVTFIRNNDTTFPSSFSKTDLNIFKESSRLFPMLIWGIGVRDFSRSRSGKLLLISFKNLISYQTFDPEKVYMKSEKYQLEEGDPLKAYEEAGLNVAIVKLNTSKSNFVKKDVLSTSKSLSERNI